MKTLKRLQHFTARLLAVAALTAALLTPTLEVKAADYAVQKTFWSFNGTWTNSPGVATNLLSAIDLTTVTDFTLSLVGKSTNTTGTGTYDFVWETSPDGSNWPITSTNAALGRSQGWFSAPITNGVLHVWLTNITVDSIGFWRIRTGTNASSCNFTNLAIEGRIKPKRTNRDL